jgi:N-methylhydantoinase A/oxoprolinase/acetone carboxylase beta subunit
VNPVFFTFDDIEALAVGAWVLGTGGGGSVVMRDPLAVGPHSVGCRLTRAALVFGGDSLTAADAAVAAGSRDEAIAAR